MIVDGKECTKLTEVTPTLVSACPPCFPSVFRFSSSLRLDFDRFTKASLDQRTDCPALDFCSNVSQAQSVPSSSSKRLGLRASSLHSSSHSSASLSQAACPSIDSQKGNCSRLSTRDTGLLDCQDIERGAVHAFGIGHTNTHLSRQSLLILSLRSSTVEVNIRVCRHRDLGPKETGHS